MKRDRWLAIIFLALAVGTWVAFFTVNSAPADPLDATEIIHYSEQDTSRSSFSEQLPASVNQLFAIPETPADAARSVLRTSPSESALYGIALKGTAGSEMAVIMDLADSTERVVRQGDAVGSGRISAIGRNTIEIDGPAGHDLLRLPAPDRAGPPDPDPSSGVAAAPFRSTAGRSDNNNTTGDLQIIDRNDLRDLVTRVEALGEEMALQPVRGADGTPAGFRITALKPRGLLARMGLRRDDTLLTVNREPIRTLEDAYRVLGSTFHQNTLELTIRRSQQNMEFTYVIR